MSTIDPKTVLFFILLALLIFCYWRYRKADRGFETVRYYKPIVGQDYLRRSYRWLWLTRILLAIGLLYIFTLQYFNYHPRP